MPPQTKGQCLPATAIKKKPSTGFICTRGCGCFFRDRCWGADSHTEEDKEKWRREAELKKQLHQIRVEQTIARLSALQQLHEAASSTKKTGATNTTAGKKTSSRSPASVEADKEREETKSSKKAGATKPKKAFEPFVSLDSDSPAMKKDFEKKRAAIREEQAQAASQAATKQKKATKKKEGTPIWQDSDSADCETRVGSMMTASARRRSQRALLEKPAWHALLSAESEAKHSDSDERALQRKPPWFDLLSAESEAKHSDSDDCSDGSTD